MKTCTKICFYLAISVIFVFQCGQSIEGLNTGLTETTAAELTDDGWNLYKEGKYAEAISKFDQAKKRDPNYPDCYNGIGWTEFSLHNISRANENFNHALNLDSTLINVNVGSAITLFENNQYIESLNSINRAITEDSTMFDMSGLPGIAEFAFEHDPQVTSKEVRIFMALDYYYLGNFSECYLILKKYLNPQLLLNENSPAFIENLYRELEKLK